MISFHLEILEGRGPRGVYFEVRCLLCLFGSILVLAFELYVVVFTENMKYMNVSTAKTKTYIYVYIYICPRLPNILWGGIWTPKSLPKRPSDQVFGRLGIYIYIYTSAYVYIYRSTYIDHYSILYVRSISRSAICRFFGLIWNDVAIQSMLFVSTKMSQSLPFLGELFWENYTPET